MKGSIVMDTLGCRSDGTTAIIQRVASASVTVDNQLISSIGKGILVFAAVAADDTMKEVESMASKVLKMKMWPDEAGATVCTAQLLDLASGSDGSLTIE